MAKTAAAKPSASQMASGGQAATIAFACSPISRNATTLRRKTIGLPDREAAERGRAPVPSGVVAGHRHGEHDDARGRRTIQPLGDHPARRRWRRTRAACALSAPCEGRENRRKNIPIRASSTPPGAATAAWAQGPSSPPGAEPSRRGGEEQQSGARRSSRLSPFRHRHGPARQGEAAEHRRRRRRRPAGRRSRRARQRQRAAGRRPPRRMLRPAAVVRTTATSRQRRAAASSLRLTRGRSKAASSSAGAMKSASAELRVRSGCRASMAAAPTTTPRVPGVVG